ncbi:HAMP domain-containing sensor histidine kinase [Clostridium sp. JS66]|uniref:HAMP domain-containing sensor histidine kinase n=1 Tax=Clostridium sp. JS66 TaxID=3064705 RepID=UPI00298DA6AE|nr:HAMP domain-containing sensor histidine kinase [Clostridium sp. JS66]WPC44259.1 HAMP domain-containing sensor histidine kinase [Clostridium sp. JS66]
MKNIYQKIALLLAFGFFIQLISFAIFYRQVVINRVITEINYQENRRQSILQKAIDDVQKYRKKTDKLEKVMDEASKKYNTNFVVKDVEENTIYASKKPKRSSTSIEKEGYLKISGKVEYIVYGYFPAKIYDSDIAVKGQNIRILIVTIILVISLLVLFTIYRVIANPLKKLSKSVKGIQYGNTLVQIPYYGKDELGLLCRNFEDMGKRLKASEDNQQELIQAISHDVKTPLTSIMGYSKRLMEGKVKEEKLTDYYEIIYKKSTDLKLLLEELEDYSNINSCSKYNKELINCNKMFENLMLDLKTELQNKNVKFNYSNLIDKNLLLKFDVNKMRRVFVNLVDNSIKYAGEGCIINITGTSNEKVLRFEVKDNGEGVKEDCIDKIFHKFYRVDSSRSREKGGTGLGLAICKDIVENHEGFIRAENLPDKGLCILIEFKVK